MPMRLKRQRFSKMPAINIPFKNTYQIKTFVVASQNIISSIPLRTPNFIISIAKIICFYNLNLSDIFNIDNINFTFSSQFEHRLVICW